MSEEKNAQSAEQPVGIVITPRALKRFIFGVIATISTVVGAWKGVDYLHYKLIGEREEGREARISMKQDFVKRYAESARAHVVNDGVVKKGHEVTIYYDQIMRLPPTDGYWFHAYIGDSNGNIIANSGGNRNPEGVWGPRFYARDWFDFSLTSFQGNGFRIPERLEPGRYTVVCILEVATQDGTFTGWLEPIPFTLVENEQ